MGGAVVDIMRRVTDGDNLVAYGTVFMAEGALLLLALFLSANLRFDISSTVSEVRAPAAVEGATGR